MEQTHWNKKFFRAEVIGAVLLCVLAPLFHFTYEWSLNNTFVGIISAVNESVWEHTKIIYFPYLFLSIIEYFIIKPDFKRFFAAKSISLALIPAIMIAFFYTYTGAFGIESLAIDIGFTFVLSAIAYVISYKLYQSERNIEKYFVVLLVMFAAVLLMELLFTAFAPHIPLFQSSVDGSFGFPTA
ncbi:MAG: DUF6512 family protein [Christensenellaceae bacterium]